MLEEGELGIVLDIILRCLRVDSDLVATATFAMLGV